MRHLQNLHTHSTYCDGADSLRDMIVAAMEKGFDSIGFSGHSFMPFSRKYSMSEEGTLEYKREIARLKDEFCGNIDIFCGLEVEMLSPVDLSGYDYLIGSAHYFKIGDEYVGFDRDGDTVKSVIDNYFGGSGMAYAKAYFELLSTLPRYGNFDIIGHFDLVAKHCEKRDFFDANSKEYLDAAFDAIDALAGKIPFFEVNTGAISRGYRTTPYPSIPITKRLLEKGFLPIISSDCHAKDKLDCAFDLAMDILEGCGAKEKYILTKDGFCAVSLR